MVVQPDGKIILGGQVSGVPHTDLVLARYHPDGTPDLSFDGGGTGSGGVIVMDLGGAEGLLGLALQADGKIVAVGGYSAGMLVMRFPRWQPGYQF